MDIIRIIIVDDHQIVADGIKALLADENDIEIIETATDADDFFALLVTKVPNLVLLDISLPGISGIEIAGKLTRLHPEIGIIMLTANVDEESVYASIKAGAKGYLPKTVKKDELVNCIHAVYMGNDFLSDGLSKSIIKGLFSRLKKGDDEMIDPQTRLSVREIEIIRLFAEGLRYKEIADRLNISTRTVESHKNNILQKLNLDNIIDLVKFAIRNGLVKV